MNYTPLYILSEYSMLHSTCHIEDIIKKAQEYELKSLAVTDLGVMHGALKLYRACKKANLKYIFGLKINYRINDVVSSILLYAKNLVGYRNLLRISSRYRLNKNAIDLMDFQNNNQGIVAVTNGFEQIMPDYQSKEEKNYILEHLNLLESAFSDIYVGLKPDNNLNNYYEFFKGANKKMVAISPVFYIEPEDSDAYKVLRAIDNNANMPTFSPEDNEAYFKSPKEMEFLFRNYPDLIKATEEISNKCNVEITFNEYQLPEFKQGLDTRRYLYELAMAGLKKRLKDYPRVNQNIYINRLNMELSTIDEMGFNDYFLIVYDYVKFAKKNNIYVGPGRGSAGASLVAYSIGITDIDPLRYNLLFERFLNKERITMPDIDIDFPDNERDKVIEYVGKRYGSNRVAHICTFGTFQVKLAINDVSRVYKTVDTHLKQVLKYINYELGLNRDISLKQIIEKNENIKRLMNDYDDINLLLKTASKIYSLPRNTSTHAAGIVITKYDLVNYTALDSGLDGIYQTQYEASDLEELGLLKMDFLGLKNLTNIARTIELIHKDNPLFKMPKEENDPRVFRMLASGNVTGVFQLESAGMRKVIMQLKASSINDIISALALYRPGPMDIIPHFINRKFGKEPIEYPHPALRPILEETYGTIVYQEQIMLIATKFAGYSLGKADILRRAVSKKKKEVLEAEKSKFIESSVRQGYAATDAEKIYDYIVKFADYGFNKAHSVAYAKVAYQTAYLKYYYPNYYLSTLLTSSLGSEKDIQDYYKECLRNNIQVYCPNINYSVDYFLPVEGGILFPLNIIRGLGNIKTLDLIEERNKGRFKSFKDFVIRTKDIIPLSVVSNIIYSGALDEFNLTKKAMIESAKTHIDMIDYEDLPGLRGVEYTKEEYSYKDLTDREKESIGINLKYNFFLQYENLYKEKGLAHIKDLQMNNFAHTLGIIEQVRVTKTKKGEEMAIFTLRDNMSQIDCVMFPAVYQKVRELSEGMIAEIIGQVKENNKTSLSQIVVEDLRNI